MIYVSGDIHGEIQKALFNIQMYQMSPADVFVLLGDVGLNYFLNHNEEYNKAELNAAGVPILCVHGNHEARPATILSYHEADWRGGKVYVEDAYPNLLFAKDGEIYDLEGRKAVVIGGAYSVDKEYRLLRGWKWFPDEQPSDEIKAYVESQLEKTGWQVDLVFTHTCPYPYEPVEAYMPDMDQSKVDKSTEAWLGTIQSKLKYKHWYCGHWHINKHLRIQSENGASKELDFLMNTVKSLSPEDE